MGVHGWPELVFTMGQNMQRHTFASHFMMSGENIRVLQSILGHSDIKMTMKYVKFSKEYLNDAVILNPLSKMDTS